MKEYPMNLQEFEKEFTTEEQCRNYIAKLRYENGLYICPKCGGLKSWLVSATVYECSEYGHQSSVIAGTIFQDTHKPLTLWFRAIWYITSSKSGTSALGLQRILGLGSYRTAWTWLHKLRRAMIRQGRDKLSGIIEVDETYIGSPESGKRGRGAGNKILTVIAVEINDNKIGRIRIGVIDDASSNSLHKFIYEVAEKDSTIVTDGWAGYNGLLEEGYKQKTAIHKKDDKETLLPHVHTIISLLKRWLLGTLQGSFSKDHIVYYYDEFTFRFNRRKSKSRGMLFYRLLQNAVNLEPVTYEDIINK
jgi:transposase-like protein